MNITNNPNCQKNMVRKGGVTAICSLLTVALITMTFSTLALIRPVQAAVSKVAVVPTGKQSAKNMKDAALRSHFNPMPPDPAFAAALQQEEAQRRLGETCQRTGDFSAAAAAYTRAHAMIPDDTSVVYHLAECAEAMGDTEAALRYYRSVVYTDAPPPLMRTIQENDGPKLIPFVLLLNKTGQAQSTTTPLHVLTLILGAASKPWMCCCRSSVMGRVRCLTHHKVWRRWLTSLSQSPQMT
jgi:hypothetical protein